MRFLADTNIILRDAAPDDPRHTLVHSAVLRLLADGHEICAATQNVYEFWVVATRPVSVNGMGLTASRARDEVDRLLDAFCVLDDPPDLLPRWLDLCTRH